MTTLFALLLLGATKTYPATVIDCYDADTCTVDLHLGFGVTLTDQVLRLCDINAPEMRGSERSRGVESRDALLAHIKAAEKIEVRVPQKAQCELQCEEKGKYGRWLAYLIADGVNLNEVLLRDKLASPYIKCGP